MNGKARQRLHALRERARRRQQEAPSYPDAPEDIAERDAFFDSIMPLQLEAMRDLDDRDASTG